jgi:hypothetical protein
MLGGLATSVGTPGVSRVLALAYLIFKSVHAGFCAWVRSLLLLLLRAVRLEGMPSLVTLSQT